MLKRAEFHSLRQAVADIPADVSNDAIGANVPKPQDMFAPETHAAALDPTTPIVVGARGAGKSFWSGVLGQDATRRAAAIAYPNLGLSTLQVGFGYTGGVGGSLGVSVEMLDSILGSSPSSSEAKAFWWATILRVAAREANDAALTLKEANALALDWEKRDELLERYEQTFQKKNVIVLVVYDALDTFATTWSRRRLLTEALLEVVWAMRAYRCIRVKLFLRPDQIDDDALRFVELPKLRTGAIRLTWSKSDLYGLLYARLTQTTVPDGKLAFNRLLKLLKISIGEQDKILSRQWSLIDNVDEQAKVMEILAGPYMGEGLNGHKKGKTYDWPIKHLADAFDEVTPRSFLGLMIAASKYGELSDDRAITSEGIRHGLRAASKTRVDQLHQEFLWIKGVLAPLAGLLLPQEGKEVFKAWKKTRTVEILTIDAKKHSYLPPFETSKSHSEVDLYLALERIGVMFSRKDGRLDMPDLFRVAAKLLKKGGTSPV